MAVTAYEELISIGKLDLSGRRVLIVGAGWMAEQYCLALAQMGVKNATIISRSRESAERGRRKFKFEFLHGGYKKWLPKLNAFDLAIIATPVHELIPATLLALQCGNNNVLIEKPASLYSRELGALSRRWNGHKARIRVAYNRIAYPNLWKLRELIDQEGGIASCRYTFTERVDLIDFKKHRNDVYQRWGVGNSLHVIAMAHYLIGMPKRFQSLRSGKLSWHRSGARFAGGGITHKGVLFSYHADWSSAGRWGIEVMTPMNAYRLIPLEQLWRCPRGSFDWVPIEVASAYPNVKAGVAEEIAVMLEPKLETAVPLISLAQAAEITRLAESIFGYRRRGNIG